jgi:hypothetical protein
MPSVIAIVSKAIFDRDAKIDGKIAGVGTVVPFERYASKNKGLAPAGEGGALFLVTVRPPDEKLWLVAILESPTFDGEHWNAPKNTVPITDITALKDQIKFTSGTGISAKKGALGMSLQTPRVLADADIALLRGGAGPTPAGASPGATHPLTGKGHLNAHEKGGPAPCLCRRCIERAPEKISIDGLDLFRDRAEGKGRFLWYWVPDSLAEEREQIRRAVQSRLVARPSNQPSSDHENLDRVFSRRNDD